MGVYGGLGGGDCCALDAVLLSSGLTETSVSLSPLLHASEHDSYFFSESKT